MSEIDNLSHQLQEYLAKEKVFIYNPARMADINAAEKMAKYLFPEAKLNIRPDPLQMGALILEIEDYDLTVTETTLFDCKNGKKFPSRLHEEAF